MAEAKSGKPASGPKKPAMELSRLDEEMYLKDTRYACGYWFEHRDNYKDMLLQLLKEDSLLKILRNAKSLILNYNETSGCIPKEYNETAVSLAYERMEQIVEEQTHDNYVQPKEVAGYASLPVLYTAKGGCKMMVYDAMDGFFSVLYSGKDKAGTTFAELFKESDAMENFLRVCGIAEESYSLWQSVMPIEYNVDDCNSYFLPQLLLYFLRILTFYDGSMGGRSVTSYLKTASDQQEHKVSAEAVRSAWTEFLKEVGDLDLGGDDDDDDDVGAPLRLGKDSSNPSGKPSNEEQQALKELSVLTVAVKRTQEEFEALWKDKKADFLKKWKGAGDDGLDSISRLGCLERMRKIVVGMANGNYRTGALYCPDLNPTELCRLENRKDTEATVVDVTFLDIVDLIVSKKKDPFLFIIKKRLKEDGKSDAQPMIALIRKLFVRVYSYLVVAEVMSSPFDRVLRCVPGYKDGEVKERTEFSGGKKKASTDARDDLPATPTDPAELADMIIKNQGRRANRVAPPSTDRSKFGYRSSTTPDGLKRCTFLRCPKVEKDGLVFQCCSACKKKGILVWYCSKECQKRDWKISHKQNCLFKKKSTTPTPENSVPEKAASPSEDVVTQQDSKADEAVAAVSEDNSSVEEVSENGASCRVEVLE